MELTALTECCDSVRYVGVIETTFVFRYNQSASEEITGGQV